MPWLALLACTSPDPGPGADGADGGADLPGGDLLLASLDPREFATVLDLRSADDYAAGHVPGATRLDPYDVWPTGVDVDPVAEADRLRLDLADLGVVEPVAIVGESTSPWGEDGWTWFLLQVAGYERISVLDGGFGAWDADLEAGPSLARDPVAPTAAARPELVATADEVAEGDALVLDVRRPDEYDAGHIPGAIPWNDADVFEADGRLRPADELLASLEAVGFAEPAIVSCAIGVRAGHASFVLTHLGYSPRSFAGSFAAWRSQGRPIE